MPDAPSPLPARILDSAKQIERLVNLIRPVLQGMRGKVTGNMAAEESLLEMWGLFASMSSEAANLRSTMQVAALPQVGIIERASVEPRELELHPVNWAAGRDDEMRALRRSLHRANDHTLDLEEVNNG